MIVYRNEDKPPTLGKTDPNKETWIIFFINELVLFNGCADRVAIDPAGPVIVIEFCIEDGFVISRPNGSTARIGHLVVKKFAC
ncbi:hypothetical protein MnTg02_01631 [bacterium MnTg02]|nr:hypothetical protein MnTg02_01631 [bacterium MnTg02]